MGSLYLEVSGQEQLATDLKDKESEDPFIAISPIKPEQRNSWLTAEFCSIRLPQSSWQRL
jgi:hypothetical protein